MNVNSGGISACIFHYVTGIWNLWISHITARLEGWTTQLSHLLTSAWILCGEYAVNSLSEFEGYAGDMHVLLIENIDI